MLIRERWEAKKSMPFHLGWISLFFSFVCSVFLVFEYCEHDLAEIVDQIPIRPFSEVWSQVHYASASGWREAFAWQFHCSSVTCWLSLFSARWSIIFFAFALVRDLKLSNLLMNNHGQVKIADFGLARKYGTSFLWRVRSRSLSWLALFLLILFCRVGDLRPDTPNVVHSLVCALLFGFCFSFFFYQLRNQFFMSCTGTALLKFYWEATFMTRVLTCGTSHHHVVSSWNHLLVALSFFS